MSNWHQVVWLARLGNLLFIFLPVYFGERYMSGLPLNQDDSRNSSSVGKNFLDPAKSTQPADEKTLVTGDVGKPSNSMSKSDHVHVCQYQSEYGCAYIVSRRM